MSITSRCATNFLPEIRQRGADYHARGRVAPTLVSAAGLFEAEVQGSDLYEVRLDWQATRRDGYLFAECTCVHFGRGMLCKHIWAAMLSADGEGETWAKFPGKGPITVEPRLSVDAEDEDEDLNDTFYEYDEDHEPAQRRSPPAPYPLRQPLKQASPKTVDWREAMTLLNSSQRGVSSKSSRAPTPKPGRLWYVIETDQTGHTGRISIHLYQQELNAKGTWGTIKEARIRIDELDRFSDPHDQAALAILLGCSPGTEHSIYSRIYADQQAKQHRIDINPRVQFSVVENLAKSGRLIYADSLVDEDIQIRGLHWDDGATFKTYFTVAKADAPKAKAGDWMITAYFERPGESLSAVTPKLVTAAGLMLLSDRLAALEPMPMAEFQWLYLIRKNGPLALPAKDVEAFVRALAHAPTLPNLRLPDDFPWQWASAAPTPRLMIAADGKSSHLSAELTFDYGDVQPSSGMATLDDANKKIFARDIHAENAAKDRLSTLASPGGTSGHFWVARAALVTLVATLDLEGWQIFAASRRLRRPSEPKLKVSGGGSGVDWFDLQANVAYGDQILALPSLLAALQRGESMVRLDDGSFGLLPAEWLKRFGTLSRLGTTSQDGWRFGDTQLLLLDSLLAAEANVAFDESFAAIRSKIARFSGVSPRTPTPGFKGILRPYQAEGLGWLHFLRDFGLGGCLADDMGLGKTIQVLALLHGRVGEQGGKPSLIVVPKSLVHNWVEEAARFAPKLRVAVYIGAERGSTLERLSDTDVLIVTYNMMRLDIAKLSTIDFDYAILDEAQHIKNDGAKVAKAARLIKARHRLAMSGTPVENHLRELGSLFEFLNPGMLGDSLALRGPKGGDIDPESIAMLGAALKPLILRRTKEQVLPDLPAKTEQTLYCDFEPNEAKAYQELRAHYHQSLKAKIDHDGMERSKIHVLEALLRLRQAACHPGLIDATKIDSPSAKIDTLLGHLEEVVACGHKALVFSQFTSLLAIVKARLTSAGIAYEYLDGKTRDRQATVARFQTDATCPVFLISLKAGGVGLNLTAADYCYILDPWWNPAAEAQAIDRAHRIGQTKKVFAYRIITRGTVEEKILTLQAKKKCLADAVVQADESFLSTMTAKDLEALLL